jgi:hypothetical protein
MGNPRRRIAGADFLAAHRLDPRRVVDGLSALEVAALRREPS